MASENYYKKQIPLVEIPASRSQVIRVMIGIKADGTEYIDLRTWYYDDNDTLQPGKGFAKPKGAIWDCIRDALNKEDEFRERFEKEGKVMTWTKDGKYVLKEVEVDE